MSKIKKAVSSAIYPDNRPSVDKDNIKKSLESKDWDDLEKYYSEIAGILYNSSLSFKEILNSYQNNHSQNANDEENKQILLLAKGYSTDLNNITVTLSKIHDSHKGKTGKPTEDEYFDTVSIIEAYINVHELIMSLLPAAIISVIEILDQIQRRNQVKTENVENV